MAMERFRAAFLVTPLTSNGTALGVITVADTAGLYVKQVVELKSNTKQPAQFQVQEVLSNTQFVIGPVGPKVGHQNFSDASSYLLTDIATISAPQQKKSEIPDKDHYLAVYESDPIVADRVVAVDKYGRFYDTDNPMPTSGGSGGSSGLTPSGYDDVDITRDSEDDPIFYTFFKNSVNIGVIGVYYNANKSSIRYKRLS